MTVSEQSQRTRETDGNNFKIEEITRPSSCPALKACLRNIGSRWDSLEKHLVSAQN